MDAIEQLKEAGLFFEVKVALNGEIVNNSEDAMNEQPLKKDEYVILKLNEQVLERISKNMARLFSLRGIKSSDEIDAKDDEVRNLVNNWKKRNKTRTNPPKNAITSFIQQVKNKHRPQEQLAFFQVITYSIMADDLFYISANNFNSKIEVEIPEEYWEAQPTNGNTIDDFMEKALSSQTPYEVYKDKNNILEWSVAIASVIMNEHEKFAETAQSYIEKALKATMLYARRNEEYSFRQKLLDELLSEEMEATNISEE